MCEVRFREHPFRSRRQIALRPHRCSLQHSPMEYISAGTLQYPQTVPCQIMVLITLPDWLHLSLGEYESEERGMNGLNPYAEK